MTAVALAEVAPPLDTPRVIHVVGVGGAGMSAIASVLASMGHRVSGSDLKESPALDRLRSQGIGVAVGHDADNVPADVELVVISTAIPLANVEVVAASRRDLPVVRRATLLAAIAALRETVAVAGTHGKTTTSSMLALILATAGLHPSFIIGGDLNEIGAGSAWDERGRLFVVEADESDGTFLTLPRAAAVVTNVEADHLEHYGSESALLDAFDRFTAETTGPVVACIDDPGVRRLARRHGLVTYGTDADADLRMTDLRAARAGTSFRLWRAGEELGEITLPVAGAHNARNAVGAVAAGLELGASFAAAREALGRFAGVARRFEHRGQVAGVTFIDDYAHLPTEVAAALAAARDGGWERIVCVFQPHRYSRTATLWRDFAGAFDDADVLAVTDVYAAGEEPRPGVSGKLVLDAVLDGGTRLRPLYLPQRRDIVTWLTTELRPGDLCLTLGAGDLTSVPTEVQQALLAVAEDRGGR